MVDRHQTVRRTDPAIFRQMSSPMSRIQSQIRLLRLEQPHGVFVSEFFLVTGLFTMDFEFLTQIAPSSPFRWCSIDTIFDA